MKRLFSSSSHERKRFRFRNSENVSPYKCHKSSLVPRGFRRNNLNCLKGELLNFRCDQWKCWVAPGAPTKVKVQTNQNIWDVLRQKHVRLIQNEFQYDRISDRKNKLSGFTWTSSKTLMSRFKLCTNSIDLYMVWRKLHIWQGRNPQYGSEDTPYMACSWRAMAGTATLDWLSGELR